MISISIRKKLVTVEGEQVLDIQLELPFGEIIAIYGASGVGKTSLLRMLAGLDKPDEGYIKVGEEVWFDHANSIWRKPKDRKAGMVFQDFALFPNMTVRANLEFAASGKGEVELINTLLQETGLWPLQHRLPRQLSGGQQQRVALARALAQQPEVLLLDEPLSALDLDTRLQMQQLLLKLHQQYGKTTLLVSHDLPEIALLAGQLIHITNHQAHWYPDVRDAFPESVIQQQMEALKKLRKDQ